MGRRKLRKMPSMNALHPYNPKTGKTDHRLRKKWVKQWAKRNRY